MKLPRFFRVSLAAKVRLLFAAALLLIVAAALFVPWDRMERLALEQDKIEAQRVATLRLMERCSGVSKAEPGQRKQIDWYNDLRLGEYPPENAASDLYIPAPERQAATGFVRKALEHFEENPGDLDVYEYRTGGEGEPRVLEYVRALRITSQCAKCHVGETAARPFKAKELAGVVHVRMPAVISEEQLWWNRVSVIAAGVIASILAVVVFYVIMQSVVLSPVRRLRRLADRIGEGELSVRSTIRTGDEFERLAKAFNSMLERLQASQQQMRQINESLNSKMDELARTNIALFESNRLKSEFLARVSHELRTPLNSIIGFAEVLREQMSAQIRSHPDDPQAPKAARYADNILTSGRMLLELINDLLDLAKIEAGKMSLRAEKVAVRELIEAVVNFMKPSAEKKNLAVKVDVDRRLPLVLTDGSKFQQILYNLFSNAVKFTPPRGQITVRVRPHGEDELQFSVHDTGPGIPPEDQEAIFEKFHQLDTSATREHGGTGLGLAISQELAAMLGGRITVDSRMGEGSTFSLFIPLLLEVKADAEDAEPAGAAVPTER